ncbi:hypothetical protein ACET3Z_002709 [Daucus carota]
MNHKHKQQLQQLLCCVLLLSILVFLGSATQLVSPGRRSLLSLPNDQTTTLVATLDGTIHLVDPKSEKVLWSQATGAPIYTSYHTPVDHNESVPGPLYYVDCGDDWMLYAHTELGKMKLDRSIREFVVNTPHVSEDGGILNGAMKTTVFVLDANSGRRIHTCGPTESPELHRTGGIHMKADELPLHITRTDYLLSYASKKYTWNVSVSEIGAAFLCQDIENSISSSRANSGNELPSKPAVQINMPLACQSKAVVARLRSFNVLEYFSKQDQRSLGYHEDMMLPAPSPDYIPPSQAKAGMSLDAHLDSGFMFALPELSNNFEISNPDVKKSYRGVLSLIPFLFIGMGALIYFCAILPGHPTRNVSANNASSRKKKNRKSTKYGGSVEKKDKKTLFDLEDGNTTSESDRKPLLNFNKLSNQNADGRVVGKLFLMNKEIAKGSNGTVVLEGIYEGRPVAVKRLVRAHHDVAFKEIQNLIASDRHSNIVRWYGVEYDQDFVYLSLELCTCSLNDLILMHSDQSRKSVYTGARDSRAMTEYKVRLDSMKGILQDIELWKANSYPSPMLVKLMRDIVCGLAHLHELGIVHRDLKPQNVLIVQDKIPSAKLSDMGISKRLAGDMSSLGHATGNGSSGWQAPEQLLHGRQTRSVDIFSLGCVLFFCITGGKHPFGDPLERDINITKNKVDLFLVQHIPEAVDLFSCLLDQQPGLRPTALEVLHHPLFWNPEMKLSFLRDTSDRVELEDRETASDILIELESVAAMALGAKWDEKMEPAFLANIGRYRRYKFDSVRDLLRVMRNKSNHYRELPKEIQELLGPVPEGFYNYFGDRFPKLLIEVYRVMYKWCKDDEWFCKYSRSAV